jgi:hypothetical protein
MRFQVPQFIDIEDKIFGPLTWKQFIFVGGGMGMGVVLFFVAPFFIFFIAGIPIAGLAFLLAFYPVNNQPFSRFLESAFYYLKKQKMYFWRKKNTGVYNDLEAANAGSPSYMPPSNTGNISSLSRRLELRFIQKQN